MGLIHQNEWLKLLPRVHYRRPLCKFNGKPYFMCKIELINVKRTTYYKVPFFGPSGVRLDVVVVTQVKLLLMRMRLAFGKLIVCP